MRPVFYLSVTVFYLVTGFATDTVAETEPDLLAGAAIADISPKTLPALRNGGFLQGKSDRILDPLFARALVLSDGKETIAIVIVDSCMFPTSLCDKIKQQAASKTGIPSNRILISATHTHSAPSAMMALGCPPDVAYVKYVPEQVAKSIAMAKDNLQPAKIGWAVIDGSDLTNCRRWITRADRMGTDPFGNRTVRAMMHPGYQNPAYTSPAGPIDPWLSVLSVVTASDEKPICILGNLSMHYFGGGAFSADYFGEVATLLEQKFGSKQANRFVGIMSQGTSGDLHWMDYSRPRRNLVRREYAKQVVEGIRKTIDRMRYRSNISLSMAEKRLRIKRRIPPKSRREWARPINASRQDRPARNQVEVYAQQVDWIVNNPTAEVVLQALRIGDLGITAIPNEVYGITGLKLKLQSPLRPTFNLELANGATGYIPPPEQHQLGGYTTWPTRTAGLIEEAEPTIVNSLLALLEKVSGRKRKTLIQYPSSYQEAVKRLNPVAAWQMDDIVSDRVRDGVNNRHGKYVGGVALFLPGPECEGFKLPGPTEDHSAEDIFYSNRSVYLAGGHLELPGLRATSGTQKDFTLTQWIRNSLPITSRHTTGVLLSNESFTLSIAGKGAKANAGRLLLVAGKNQFFGKTKLAINHWHQVTVTSKDKTFRVFLDGKDIPEIETNIHQQELPKMFLVGSNKNNDFPLDGKVDAIALFDRAISPTEIADLYRVSGQTRPPKPKPQVLLGAKPTDAKSRKRYADAVLASKPIAYWRLHSRKDGKTNDELKSHHAEFEPLATQLPQTPTEPNFTGGRVKARLPGLSHTYSVELWFRNELPNDSRPVTAYVFSRAADGVHGAMGDNLGIGGTHSNTGQLIVFNGNERNQLAAGRAKIAPGSWSYVVLVRQEQNIRVYLNGSTQPEIESILPIDFPDNCEELFLGGRADNFANLQGMLEEVAIYDRILSPKEIKAHFDAAGVKPIDAKKFQRKAKEEPSPVPPSKALETIHVRNGFKVQLVAAEPLVQDPVAIDWGADGKLWVVEMADYPLGIDGQGKPGGRVRFLEDEDGNGTYDRSTLFADQLSFPTGIMTWGKGVIVTAAPQIVYLEDSTGDGKANIRRVLYSGFLEGNQQLRVNGLRWGLDNWIYCASGSHHAGYGKDSRIKSHLNGISKAIGSRDFRIRPDSGSIAPQSGPSQYGRNRDDWGNWFGVQNSHPLWHYVLADHHIRRNPFYAPPDPRQQVVTPVNPKVFPYSQLQKRYHSFNQSGRFTSACSPMVYRDNLLFDSPKESHAFTCEPFHNLVQHNVIFDKGTSFGFRRDPEENETDFFASKDRWCRPVMVRTGPDGAIWIVDMYRYMIEHPQWLPQNGKDELRPWFRSGEDRGRIFRVFRKDLAPRQVPELSTASDDKLVDVLNSPNGWLRDLAHRTLVTNKRNNAIPLLKSMVTNGKRATARLHALCALDGLQALPTSLLEKALTDPHPGVRTNAVRIARRITVNSSKLAAISTDANSKVRLQLAATLGSYSTPETDSALAQLIMDPKSDRYLLAAAISSLSQKNVSQILDTVMQDPRPASDSNSPVLIGQAIALGGVKTLTKIVDSIGSANSRIDQRKRFEFLATALESSHKNKLKLGKLPQSAQDAISKIMQSARKAIADPKSTQDLQVASISLLGRDPAMKESDFQLLKNRLEPKSPVQVQREIVEVLGQRNDIEVAQILTDGWRSHGPNLRSQILDVLLSRKPWSDYLLDQVENDKISIKQFDATIRQRILALAGKNSRWKSVLSGQKTSTREQVLAQYRGSLTLKGERTRGQEIFRTHCINCHRHKNNGFEVGPQLGSVTNKSKEALLNSILDPNAAVDAKFLNFLVDTVEGRSFTGILETETGSSITLKAAEGKRVTVLRRNIERMKTTNQSLMPEGLEKDLKPQDLADLIEFIRLEFN